MVTLGWGFLLPFWAAKRADWKEFGTAAKRQRHRKTTTATSALWNSGFPLELVNRISHCRHIGFPTSQHIDGHGHPSHHVPRLHSFSPLIHWRDATRDFSETSWRGLHQGASQCRKLRPSGRNCWERQTNVRSYMDSMDIWILTVYIYTGYTRYYVCIYVYIIYIYVS